MKPRTLTFSFLSISAPQAIKKSLKILFPSFPVVNAKVLLWDEGLACLYSSHRRYSCSLSKLFLQREGGGAGGGGLSNTICLGSACWVVHYSLKSGTSANPLAVQSIHWLKCGHFYGAVWLSLLRVLTSLTDSDKNDLDDLDVLIWSLKLFIQQIYPFYS